MAESYGKKIAAYLGTEVAAIHAFYQPRAGRPSRQIPPGDSLRAAKLGTAALAIENLPADDPRIAALEAWSRDERGHADDFQPDAQQKALIDREFARPDDPGIGGLVIDALFADLIGRRAAEERAAERARLEQENAELEDRLAALGGQAA
jgi:hypothetical protein